MPNLQAEIRARLTRYGADPQVPDDRGDLKDAIGRAVQNAIEKRLGRSLDVTRAAEAYDGKGINRITLRRDPVRLLRSVTVSGSALVVEDLTATTPSYPPPSIVLDSTRDAIVRTDGVFSCGIRNVIVDYDAGLSAEDDPAAYEAVFEWALAVYKALPRVGVTSQTFGETTYGFTDKIPTAVVEFIASRKRVFAP